MVKFYITDIQKIYYRNKKQTEKLETLNISIEEINSSVKKFLLDYSGGRPGCSGGQQAVHEPVLPLWTTV